MTYYKNKAKQKQTNKKTPQNSNRNPLLLIPTEFIKFILAI